MEVVVEITVCERCGKSHRKDKLHKTKELLKTKLLCKGCYMKFQRYQWGYW